MQYTDKVKFVCPICACVKIQCESYPWHGTRVCAECWEIISKRIDDADDTRIMRKRP